jgi:hypothetical protein
MPTTQLCRPTFDAIAACVTFAHLDTFAITYPNNTLRQTWTTQASFTFPALMLGRAVVVRTQSSFGAPKPQEK